MLLAMATNMDSMTRAIVGPDLEKELGHPVTDGDWWLYQQEEEKRQVLAMAAVQDRVRASWNNLQAQFQQLFSDRQIIRDFVWSKR